MQIVCAHVAALAVFLPGTFSVSAVASAFVFFYAIGLLGITVGFHRLLTHRSFAVPKIVEYAIATIGTLALQGGPIEWVATHRKHHAFTDRDGDPHSARRGFRWSHVRWLYGHNEARLTIAEQRRYAPDLADDGFYQFLDRYHRRLQVVILVALFVIGGWPLLIWAGFVRIVVMYHVTWVVNSLGHTTGYRTYATGDLSTNNGWIAALTWGEGWHNNHHAFPSSARHGLTRSEVDVTWMTIRFLAFCRIARDIKVPSSEALKRASEKMRIREAAS